MSLNPYNKKRNFLKTKEPKGKISRSKKNQLYIIQKHAASHLHYDFRLELNGVLLSWAIPKGPCLDPAVKRLAIHVEDHPVEYGGFEGIIPKGQYGGGTVMLWDKGKWIPEDEDVIAAYKKGHLRFQLKAKKLNGRWSLIKFKKEDDKSWFLIKSKDEYAKSLSIFDITEEEPDSVISHKTMDEITESYKKIWEKKRVKKVVKKKPQPLKKIKINAPISKLPQRIFPQLATLVDAPPKGKTWLHEIKFDGYRMITYKDGNLIRLMSRNNKEWTAHFDKIVGAIKKLPQKKLILDGEVVVLDKAQHSNFQLLQNAIKSNEKVAFIYYIFDLLYYADFNLMHLPLVERKAILHKLIPSVNGPILRYSDHVIGSGDKIFNKACDLGLEGIISKEAHSQYEEKRSKNWLKVKCIKRQEFVIGGYMPPKKGRDCFGSLCLGVFNPKKEFVYCGNVGTGFTQASLEEIFKQLKKYKTPINPFNPHPPGIKTAIWVKPKLIAEIEFTEWTNEGSLRHPSFKGLRMDKSPSKIIREREAVVKKIVTKQSSYHLTHPEKILYPEDKISKEDIANYYEEIQDWILPYIVERPLSLLRCPDGYKACFFQKHFSKASNVLHSIPIKTKTSVEPYVYINDLAGLMALVQMGVLEIHPWGSQIGNIERPDFITFDLDPAPDVAWKKVVAVALLLKKELAKLDLKSFVKTTGGKGLHVVVPIKPKYEWHEVKDFTHAFVDLIVSKHPDEYVSNMSKAKRPGKIFLDYLRNQRGATAVGAYSTRARKHAPVSTPLDWKELTEDFEDTFFTLLTLPARLKKLKKDPWADFFKIRQSLKI